MYIRRTGEKNFRWLVSFLFLLFFISTGLAQITWRRMYGGASFEKGYSVDQTTDGGYIVTGFTFSFGNGRQVYLIRIDSLGDTLWTRNFGGTGEDFGIHVQQTTDGGYIVVGYTNSFGNDVQIYLIKTDSLGDTLWTKTYGGPGTEVGYWVQQTSDGGYIITGGGGFSWGLDPVYLIKTDSSGNVEWSKVYCDTVQSLGVSVQQTSDGGYIITGGHEFQNIYLIKTDSLGNTLWAKGYYSGNIGWGHSVQQTSDGGYFVTGFLILGGWLVLLKTDSLGDTLWVKTYKGPYGALRGFCGQQTTDGGYIATGRYDIGQDSLRSAFLLKTDSLGNMLWFREHRSIFPDAPAAGNSVQQTMDGGYIIAGETSGNGGDVYLIKTDQDGNVAGVGESGYARHLFSQPQLLAYPNPFTNKIDIRYTILDTGYFVENVALKIYDISGRLVRTLKLKSSILNQVSGIVWNGDDDAGHPLPPGVYFCRLEINETAAMTKIIKLE